MRWQTHLVFGLLFGLVWISIFGVSNKYFFMGFVCFAALLPDIDHPESKLGNKIKPISWLIKRAFGHRGFFHSIWPALGLYLLFVYVFGWRLAGLGLSIGFMSHLFSDALTLEGVNFGHPLKARVQGFIRTGGPTEWVFFGVCLVLCFLNLRILF